MIKKIANVILFSRRNYAKTFNYLGKKTVDTTEPEHPNMGLIPEQAEDVGVVSGVPIEHIKERVAYIHSKIRNCMQSGTFEYDKWCLEFDKRESWENPLMGWESTGDPLDDTSLEFPSKEDAIMYCVRMGYKYEIRSYQPNEAKHIPKSYAENFSWNKKTRIDTK